MSEEFKAYLNDLKDLVSEEILNGLADSYETKDWDTYHALTLKAYIQNQQFTGLITDLNDFMAKAGGPTDRDREAMSEQMDFMEDVIGLFDSSFNKPKPRKKFENPIEGMPKFNQYLKDLSDFIPEQKQKALTNAYEKQDWKEYSSIVKGIESTMIREGLEKYKKAMNPDTIEMKGMVDELKKVGEFTGDSKYSDAAINLENNINKIDDMQRKMKAQNIYNELIDISNSNSLKEEFNKRLNGETETIFYDKTIKMILQLEDLLTTEEQKKIDLPILKQSLYKTNQSIKLKENRFEAEKIYDEINNKLTTLDELINNYQPSIENLKPGFSTQEINDLKESIINKLEHKGLIKLLKDYEGWKEEKIKIINLINAKILEEQYNVIQIGLVDKIRKLVEGEEDSFIELYKKGKEVIKLTKEKLSSSLPANQLEKALNTYSETLELRKNTCEAALNIKQLDDYLQTGLTLIKEKPRNKEAIINLRNKMKNKLVETNVGLVLSEPKGFKNKIQQIINILEKLN